MQLGKTNLAWLLLRGSVGLLVSRMLLLLLVLGEESGASVCAGLLLVSVCRHHALHHVAGQHRTPLAQEHSTLSG
jgi:hypothetical protein